MNKFLKGAAILTVSGIIIKILGLFFRIPLTLWVGGNGLSYYSSVYSIYTLVLTLSTAGFPTAVSRMVSERVAVENYKGAKQVLKVCRWFLTVLGFLGFCFLFFGADFIALKLLKNDGTQYSLMAIAPSLLLVPLMSVHRGYFQGRQNMVPTALSQFVEQVFRVGFGLLLAYEMIPRGNVYVSAAATSGCTAGAFFGLLIISGIYRHYKPQFDHEILMNQDKYVEESTGKLIKEILAISIPITIGACILPLLNSIDSMMVMGRLQETGWTVDESRVLFGRLGGYCSSIINLPTVFVSAITLGIVPLLSKNHKLQNDDLVRKDAQFMSKLAMLVGAPCAVGLFSLSYPILKLLYPTAKVAQEVIDAVPTLRVLCFVVLLTALTNTFAAILQSVGKQIIPVRNFFIGAIFKVIFTYILVGIPAINVNGGPIGSIICYLIVVFLDILAIKKYIGVKYNFKETFLMPFVSALVMGVCAFFTHKIIYMIVPSNAFATLCSILLAVIIFVIMIFLTKSITREEILEIPRGEKFVQILDKVRRNENR